LLQFNWKQFSGLSFFDVERKAVCVITISINDRYYVIPTASQLML
jgi:hypothetical protein